MQDSRMAALRSRLREGRLPCAEVFALAAAWRMAPAEVAAEAETQGVRVGWCQLGLFTGERKGKGRPDEPLPVPEQVQAILQAAAPEGRLPCAQAWVIARRLGWERPAVGHAADTLGIRIVRCQLGFFP